VYQLVSVSAINTPPRVTSKLIGHGSEGEDRSQLAAQPVTHECEEGAARAVAEQDDTDDHVRIVVPHDSLMIGLSYPQEAAPSLGPAPSRCYAPAAIFFERIRRIAIDGFAHRR
jgi:hypothetical protein